MNTDNDVVIRIGSIEVQPYTCHEDWEEGNDILIIDMKTLVTQQQHHTLQTMLIEGYCKEKIYHSVVRIGRDLQPRTMRFGKPAWSQHEQGIKYHLLLLDEKYDKTFPHDRAPAEEVNYQTMALRDHVLLDELSRLLIQKGIITEVEYEQLRSMAIEKSFEHQFNLYRATDIDLFQ